MGYGPFAMNIPPLEDSDLVYSEDETRQIFKYFYPDLAGDIDKCKIDNTGIALAQTMVLAAVDATYAMSYVKAALDIVMGNARKPSRDILKLIRKAAEKMGKNYLRHAKNKNDLKDPTIYDSVRMSTALTFKSYANDYISGARLLSMNLSKKGFRGHIAVMG